MKKLILATILVVSSSSVKAEENKSCNQQPHPKKSALEKCRDKVKDTYKEIANLNKKIRSLELALAEKDGESKSKVVVEPIKETVKEVVVFKVLEKAPLKNSLSLVVPYAPTSLEVNQDSNGFSAKTVRKLDAGLIYQRDFNRVRGSVGATVGGSALLGLGYNF